MTTTRPNKEQYYLTIARDVAMRSTCLRSHYGAIIVKNDQIVATGYNGAARGLPNCSDIGTCHREGIPSRERYELCRAVHAEANALLHAGRNAAKGGIIYIAGMSPHGYELSGDSVLPCAMCYRLLLNSGITHVCIVHTVRAISIGGSPHVMIPLEDLSHLDSAQRDGVKK